MIKRNAWVARSLTAEFQLPGRRRAPGDQGGVEKAVLGDLYPEGV